ncbi:MAG: hypothetical protein HYU99_11805 [Deltaproteobacteria bacterium]|nr:hypothetical protein [Deltaproteobacteria bacterium]
MDTPPVTGTTLFPFADPSANGVPPAGESHVLQLIGDEQYFDDPEALGFYRSLTVLGVGPPGLRLPGMTFGVPFLHEALAQDIPPEYQGLYQGMIAMGDAADVASTEEIKMFIHTLARLKEMNKTYPVGRLLLFLIGNHDVFHAGTANSGSNFFGLLGVALNLQWGRNYTRDVHGAEVGSEGNILNKARLIEFIYRFFLEEEPNTVQLAYSYAPSESLREKQSNSFFDTSSTYRIKGENKKNWQNTTEVFNDFWHQSKDESFNALVKYLPNKDKRPEQSLLSVSAVKMEDLETANGNHPVYFIALDTMDYLKDGSEFGATSGHVSSIQVQIVKAFIAEMTARHPGAKPKFILGGHFPATSITNLKISGLNEILSDEEVIAYVAGHTHERGFEDLADRETAFKYGINRANPLPMIVVPAVMDFPNETVFLKYGVENPESNKLYFEFTFHGIDWRTIPGLNGDVIHELRQIYPYLDSFTVALSKIDNEQLCRFADPATPLYDKGYLALSLDEGLLTRPGAINDFVIAQDVIPTMVENNILYKRLFLSMVKLNLMDLGLQAEADSLADAYLQRLNHLMEYYERIRSENYLDGDDAHQKVHDLDGFSKPLDVEVDRLKEIAPKFDPEKFHDEEEWKKQLAPQERQLVFMADATALMQEDLNYFKDWLIRFEKLRRSEARDEDYRKMTDLFGNHYFKTIRSHLWNSPPESAAAAFAALVHLVSAKMYRAYRKPLTSQFTSEREVPDRIRVEVSTETGAISFETEDLPDPPPLPSFEGHFQEGAPPPIQEETKPDQKEGLSDLVVPSSGTHYLEFGKKEDVLPVEEEKKPAYRIPWHWQWRAKGYLGYGTTVFNEGRSNEYRASGYNNGFHMDIGAQAHLLSRPKLPRINVQGNVGTNLEFQNRNVPVEGGIAENTSLNIDVPLQGALTFGDPFGIFDVGPLIEIGPSWVQYDTDPLDGRPGSFKPSVIRGTGLQLNLLEGAVWFQWLNELDQGGAFSMDEHSRKLGPVPMTMMLGVDFFQMGRWASMRDRDK